MNFDETQKGLMGLLDVARRLGVSVFTIRRLADSGELKTVHVGARRLVPLSEVARVVATGAGKPRARRATPNASKRTTHASAPGTRLNHER
jgi:excisionase family DNA binding protein